LAWVLIGGLTSSMILTLVLVPAIYLIFDIFLRKISNRKAKEILKQIKKEGRDIAISHSTH
jgi:HAE1 family hydrophobic/amphiphilic exporter-1